MAYVAKLIVYLPLNQRMSVSGNRIGGWEGKMNMDSLIDAPEGALAQKLISARGRGDLSRLLPELTARANDEFMDILYLARHWWSPNDGDMGPIPAALAGYEVVALVGRPVDLEAALGSNSIRRRQAGAPGAEDRKEPPRRASSSNRSCRGDRSAPWPANTGRPRSRLSGRRRAARPSQPDRNRSENESPTPRSPKRGARPRGRELARGARVRLLR